jgi:uncharacterized membrane protein
VSSVQIAKGERPSTIDRQIALRGLVIAAFELWISWFVVPPRTWLLQVLYAIGIGFLFMVPLRRLSNGLVLALSLFLIVAGEALVGLAVQLGPDPANPPLALALLLVGGERGPLIIGYPPIHWLAIMLLGWVWGRALLRKSAPPAQIARQLALAGAAALGVYVVVRGANGYGNMLLYREDHSLVQWLHVSKYPPAITYTTLELGIMALVMAGLFWLTANRTSRADGLLVTLGQTPMFFYLLHFPLLVMASEISGLHHQLGLLATYAGAAGGRPGALSLLSLVSAVQGERSSRVDALRLTPFRRHRADALSGRDFARVVDPRRRCRKGERRRSSPLPWRKSRRCACRRRPTEK